AAPGAFAQQPTFTPYHANGIYDPGEKVGWTVTWPQGAAAPAGPYAYTVRKNNFGDPIKTGSLDLAGGPATIEVALDEPAMLYVHAHDKPPGAPTGPPGNYPSVGNTDRETSYFLNMYLRDYRAIDYLTSRPEWDGKTLVLMGTSMGGQQSLCLAGLHPRVTHLIVHVPSGSDFSGPAHGRSASYPNWPTNNPAVVETARYFDAVNFAPRIKATALV